MEHEERDGERERKKERDGERGETTKRKLALSALF